jgi:predicted unusual protein kinase regulating ubiquinone biosynthesis (AarF/ABC1/UbiB family)
LRLVLTSALGAGHGRPTFIKLGQSASIRTDLLPPAYITGLTALQDQVPPFSSDEARRIIREELGMDASRALADMSAEPIAAASLGQVYKATLPNGTVVAVKVQRPEMERRVALDMHLLRGASRALLCACSA